MVSKLVYMLLWVVFFFGGWCWCPCDACWDIEKTALLQLKPFFESYTDGVNDWGKKGSDCCEWENVECNNSTRRVIQLVLDAAHDGYGDEREKWYLNVSLFLPFEELHSLHLGGNAITGFIDHQGDELRLKKLEVLGLSFNSFNNSIFSSLSYLSNLKYLDITFNKLEGPIHIKDISALNNLEELHIGDNNVNNFVPSQDNEKLMNLKALDLSGNLFNNTTLASVGRFSNLKSLTVGGTKFQGSINLKELITLTHLEDLSLKCGHGFLSATGSSNCSLQLQSLGLLRSLKTLDLRGFSFEGNIMNSQDDKSQKISNLEELDLSYCFLQTNFFGSIGQFTRLKRIQIPSCEINGSLTLQDIVGICELGNLKDLDLRGNDLKGSLPECFSNLASLQSLDLSFNQLSGNISPLQALTSLQTLDLSSNQFSGNISPLKSVASLQELKLSDNNFHIPVSLEPLFNLSKLKLVHADNNIVHPETLMHSLGAPVFQLEEFRLSCCGDVGSFPEFLYHQHHLEYLDLSNLYFKGKQFPYWLLENNTRSLQTLHLRNCSLSGPLLPLASRMRLYNFDISNNFFNGSIPVEIGEQLPLLEFLNMSSNLFTGSLPSAFGDMTSLVTLVLSNNQLEGNIFSENSYLPNLFDLQLKGNNFSGWIPDVLSKSPFLSILDVSNNQLSGGIPKWMGNMSSLEKLMMSNNHLQGTFPVEFCQLDRLMLLDLSVNNISGSIPSCFGTPWLRQVHLSKNRLEGSLPNALRNSSTLVTLDISHNFLTGIIPSWIGELSDLSYLLLGNNNFQGEIPMKLCNLNQLCLINLSHNNLSGRIPPCLKITALEDVSEVYVNDIIASNLNIFSLNEPIDFPIKNVSNSYRGRIIRYISGIDLSCNKLVGEIPYGLGNLYKILVLNLSHNSLTGPIPPTFANLKQIESLDLSYNKLRGNIPPQLVGLNFLAFFIVSFNNLSGKVPPRVAQFGTFDESSYRGNPFLCGEPLPKCGDTASSSPTPKSSTDNDEDDHFIDMEVFHVSFTVSYMVMLLTVAVVLYINPYWRRALFYRVETTATSCYYFVLDNILPRRFHC